METSKQLSIDSAGKRAFKGDTFKETKDIAVQSHEVYRHLCGEGNKLAPLHTTVCKIV